MKIGVKEFLGLVVSLIACCLAAVCFILAMVHTEKNNSESKFDPEYKIEYINPDGSVNRTDYSERLIKNRNGVIGYMDENWDMVIPAETIRITYL